MGEIRDSVSAVGGFLDFAAPAGGASRRPVGFILVPDLAVDDVAEQAPGLAVELHQLHLFDRKVIIR
jgi:hypothetical protein